MRICFVLRVKCDKLEEYKRRHAQVWPEMLDALRQTGWRNYSLFLQADGLLIGYLETDNFDNAYEGMKNHPINSRWQAEMSPFFEALNGAGPDDRISPLDEVFHLD